MQPAGEPDMEQLLAQAQQMQEQMETAQAELARIEVTGSAGGGLVTATVSGDGDLKALTIAREAVDPDDTETLADLVIAAIRAANEQAQDLVAEKMGSLAGGLGGLGMGM